MTSREREVLDLIKKNPMISHTEIAQALNISRSTAAVYIASLTQQGEIIGKQYVLAENYVVCIGSSNADIFAFFDGDRYVPGRSAQGRLRVSSGGAVRNVGENLARLGTNVKLLSAIGDDKFGEILLHDCAAAHVDVTDVKIVPGGSSAVYFGATSKSGEVDFDIYDHEIVKEIDVEYIKSKEHLIKNARAIVVSALPNPSIVPYLHAAFPDKPIFGDATTTETWDFTVENLSCYDSLQANRAEAEHLTGISIRNDETLSKAADYLIRRGVHRVVITLGADGAYYKDADGMALRRRTKPADRIVNSTGAGDAFSAGYIHCLLEGRGPVYALDFAMACALLALSAEGCINPNLCDSLAEQIMADYCGE